MKLFALVKPGKTLSAFAVVAGVGMLFFGIFGLFPHSPVFGFFWCALVLAMMIFYGVNAFTQHGIASEEIEIESVGGTEQVSIEGKLTRLERLRNKKLISEREYQEKRKELMRRLV